MPEGALVVVSVGVMESALPLSLVVLELSRVVGAIGEIQFAVAVAQAVEPLSEVVAAAVQLDGGCMGTPVHSRKQNLLSLIYSGNLSLISASRRTTSWGRCSTN